MAKMMWMEKSRDSIVLTIFLVTICLTLCLTAPTEPDGKKGDTSSNGNGPETKAGTLKPAEQPAVNGKPSEKPVPEVSQVDKTVKDTTPKAAQGTVEKKPNPDGVAAGEYGRGDQLSADGKNPTIKDGDKQGEAEKDPDPGYYDDSVELAEKGFGRGDLRTGNAFAKVDTGDAKKKQDGVQLPTEQKIVSGDSSTPSSGSFMTYFIVCVIIVVILYVAFHHRHKILAYVVEGRRSRATGGRRRGASGGSTGGATVEYSRLNNAVADELLSASSNNRGASSDEAGKPDYMY